MAEIDEQLYGREGTEQAAGYRPMLEPPAETAADSSPLDDDRLRKHFDRDASVDFGTEVERSFVSDDGSGRRRPENETVELDSAAKSLTRDSLG